MKKAIFLIVLFVICFTFNGCLKDGNESLEKTVEMTIFPETGYGTNMMGEIWTDALVFMDSDNVQKLLLLDIITEGFDFTYERGYEYRLRVKKVWMEEPPMDVWPIKYIFIEEIAKKQIITKDSEENIQLFVSSQTVKYTPGYPREYENGSAPKVYDALHVKTTGSANWMALTAIEGFSFEKGFEYVLNVKKITKASPYSVKYVLLDVVSKTKKG